MRAAFVVVIVLGWLAGVANAGSARWETLPLPPAMPQATKSSTITVDGAQIYYAIYGTPSAEPPVILLHGGLGNSDHWANQVPALVDAKHEVIAIDSRGQGRSTRTNAKISYDVMASDVIAVMDALAVKQGAMVGWSDGGEIALKLAISHPERVAKLFVFGANYNSEGSKPRRSGPTPTFSAYAQKCRADYLRMSKTPKQFDDLTNWLLAVWRDPMNITKEQLVKIEAPAMIADGDHDEVIVLAQVQEMAKLIPHAQLKVFDDASHFALWQDPQDFNKALVEFLAPPSAPAKL